MDQHESPMPREVLAGHGTGTAELRIKSREQLHSSRGPVGSLRTRQQCVLDVLGDFEAVAARAREVVELVVLVELEVLDLHLVVEHRHLPKP